MSDEWFKEHKDLHAAAAAFLMTFEGIEKKERERLAGIFVKYFSRYYEDVRGGLVSFESAKEISKPINCVKGTMSNLGFNLNSDQGSIEEHSYNTKVLGMFFGSLLAIAEFGICSKNSFVREAVYMQGDEIITQTKKISQELKKINRKINFRIVERRIQKIIRKNYRYLDEKQKILLSYVAAALKA